MSARLSIETLARYRAALEGGGKKEAIIEGFGETIAEWNEQEERLLAELADETDRGVFDRIEEYQAAYKVAWAASVQASTQERGAAGANASGDRSRSAPVRDLDATSEVARGPAEPVLPFSPGDRPSVYAKPSATTTNSALPPAGDLDTTAETATNPPSVALPFGAASTFQAPGAGASRDTLASNAAPPARSVGPAIGDVEPMDDLDGTRELVGEHLTVSALPFGSAPDAPGAAFDAPAAVSPTFRTGTEDVDVAKLRALVMPFGGGPRGSGGPAMGLEDYARLRARLTIHGEAHAPTWSEFGIKSQDDKDQLQQRFAARFRADPAAQARFVSLVRMFATAEPGTRPTSAVTGAPSQATARLPGEATRQPSPPASTDANVASESLKKK